MLSMVSCYSLKLLGTRGVNGVKPCFANFSYFRQGTISYRHSFLPNAFLRSPTYRLYKQLACPNGTLHTTPYMTLTCCSSSPLTVLIQPFFGGTSKAIPYKYIRTQNPGQRARKSPYSNAPSPKRASRLKPYKPLIQKSDLFGMFPGKMPGISTKQQVNAISSAYQP